MSDAAGRRLRFGIASSAACALIGLAGCASVMPASDEEMAIVRATLAAEMVTGDAPPRRVQMEPMTGPAWLTECLDDGYAEWPIRSAETLNIRIPSSLPRELVRVNRKRRRLDIGSLSVYLDPSATKHSPMLQVSRPAISPAGDEALIGVAFWRDRPDACSNGEFVYLRKENAVWLVKAFGCFWVT